MMWRRAPRRRAGHERGQSLVELALVGPVLALLLLGIIELVGMFSTRGYISDATRAGDRLAALNYGDNDTLNAILSTLTNHSLNSIHNGACDVQSIEIFNSNGSGAPITANNSDEIYSLQPVFGTCQPQLTYNGWPQSARNVIASPGSPPPNIGVRVSYRYSFRTPVFTAFSKSISMQYSAVLALGGDNANNFLALPSSTPAPTFTSTNTPTSTPTQTPTPLPTFTPTLTPVPQPTSTFAGGATWTPTAIPSSTATPTQTPTPTSTPVPTLTGVTAFVPCDSSGHILSPPGIKISWSGTVPGATYYDLYYKDASGLPTLDATGISPSVNKYPAVTPPYYSRVVTAGGQWYLVAHVSGGGSSTSYTAVLTTSCLVNS